MGITRSPLGIPVVRVEAGHGYRRLFLRLFFPHFSLTTFSTISVQLFLYFAIVLHSPPTLPRSLITQSSHRILGLPRLLSRPISGHLTSLPIFVISHSFYTTGPFQPTRSNLATNTLLIWVMTGLGLNHLGVLVNT